MVLFSVLCFALAPCRARALTTWERRSIAVFFAAGPRHTPRHEHMGVGKVAQVRGSLTTSRLLTTWLHHNLPARVSSVRISGQPLVSRLTFSVPKRQAASFLLSGVCGVFMWLGRGRVGAGGWQWAGSSLFHPGQGHTRSVPSNSTLMLFIQLWQGRGKQSEAPPRQPEQLCTDHFGTLSSLGLCPPVGGELREFFSKGAV